MDTNISNNINTILRKIADLKEQYKRDDNINLLCVSKTKPIEAIIEAYDNGQRHFGENYAKEMFDKVELLNAKGYKDIIWHFIGPIQSNKIKLIANSASMVESIDKIKTAIKLNELRDTKLGALDVLIQVNISNEEQKSGCSYEDIDALINEILKLKNLRLRGLMAIGLNTSDEFILKEEFSKFKRVFDLYSSNIKDFNILSLGMTHDMDIAIENGSTEVRIGTAIFGQREYKRD